MAGRAAAHPLVDPDVARDLGVREGARPSRRARRLALAALALVAIGVAAWLVSARLSGSGDPQWITEPARRGDLTVTVSATGTVEPLGRVEVSAEVSGRIAEVHVDDNDAVTRGQLLAVIDREPIEVRLGEARARVAAARAELRRAEAVRVEARRTLERTEELAERGAAPAAARHR